MGSVYAECTAPLSQASLAWAGALAAGTESVVSHVTAARLWGLRTPSDPEVHVIAPRDSRLQVTGLRTHRVALAESEMCRLDGIVITTTIRTVLDCTLWLGEEAGRALLVDAVQRRLLVLDDVRTALRLMGQRHGLSRAWSIVADLSGGAHSEAEVRAHKILAAAGIRGWEANVAVHDLDGLVGVVDLLFEEAKVVVEIDGRAYHSDDLAFQRDRVRQNRLVAAGYTVLRFTWDDVVNNPDRLVALVRTAVAGTPAWVRPRRA